MGLHAGRGDEVTVLHFTDGSGPYALDLSGVLDGDGNIDRSAPCRLERTPS